MLVGTGVILYLVKITVILLREDKNHAKSIDAMAKQLLINNTLELYSTRYLLCQLPAGFTAKLCPVWCYQKQQTGGLPSQRGA